MSTQSKSNGSFFQRYTTAILTAGVIGIVSFLAIATSDEYGNDVAARIGNSIGAGISFTLISFVVGYAVTKARRRASFRSADARQRTRAPNWTSAANVAAPRESPPQGPADQLRLEQLDRIVRDSAHRHWPHGNFVAAVEDAARAVNANLQSRSSIQHLTEQDLINHLYSDKPVKPGDVRLRFPGDRTTKTWTSRTNGARALGTACFSGIRNVAAHQHRPDWSREDAFEYLVMFSVLMRWTTECEIERT